MSAFNVVCWLSPKQELQEDLAQLKETLGIPNGLPPCVENARLDFGKICSVFFYNFFTVVVVQVVVDIVIIAIS